MARFFNKLRQRLASDNKFLKYLFYALGEIVLVVIGILLALQINNWNAEREVKKEINTIYASMVDELDADIKILDEYIPEFQWKNKLLTRIAAGEIPASEWIANDSLFRSFSSFPDFKIGQERFQLLKTRLTAEDSAKQLNRRIADFYHKYGVDLEIKQAEASLSFNRNIAYWEEHDEWLADAYFKRDYTKLGIYTQHNAIFRNKITWYRIVLRRLEKSLTEYQDAARLLKHEIRRMTDA